MSEYHINLIDDTSSHDGLEVQINKIGSAIFHSAHMSTLPWSEGRFTQILMDWAMRRPALKVAMFRFVDALPSLTTNKQIAQHLREYFLNDAQGLPKWIKMALATMLSNPVSSASGSFLVKKNVSSMAHFFIAGADVDELKPKLTQMWQKGLCFTADILGEAVVSDKEARHYQQRYFDLIVGLSELVKSWDKSFALEKTSFGFAPRANISVKCSCLYPQIDPLAFRVSVEGIKNGLRPILSEAVREGIFVNLDMEQNDWREIILTVAEEIFSEEKFRDYPHFGLVIQAYLRHADFDLERVIRFSATRKSPLTVRLVKGAYWDYEVAMAKQRGLSSPVFLIKSHTDANYEKLTRHLVDSYPKVLGAYASHNVRSLAHALAYAEEKQVPRCDFEIQMLYGMADPFKNAFHARHCRVREYVPMGELLPGMAYLVRRLLENTANEGFLHESFVKKLDGCVLLRNPAFVEHQTVKDVSVSSQHEAEKKEGVSMFKNQAMIDFSDPKASAWIDKSVQKLRAALPQIVPVQIEGRAVKDLKESEQFNPSHSKEIVTRFSLATKTEVEAAINSCDKAFVSWRETAVYERAKMLRSAADLMLKRREELMTLMVFEVGKNFREADADVCEAIDFCRFYADQAEALLAPQSLATLPGEENTLIYTPRGIAVTIAPWNFPLAILCGMTVAALVSGNPVIMKPAEQSSAIAYEFYKILREAGVPAGVLQFLPGAGEVVGEALVSHPKVHVISFTGSRTVGLSILEKAAHVGAGQKHVKKVMTEMGGKNAVIIDDDADLDEAVQGCLQSAFGFSGQKCSALSRIIVLDGIYKKFRTRFIEGLQSICMGPADDVKARIGAVINAEAHQRLIQIIEKYKNKIVAQLEVPLAIRQQGYYVPATVFEETDSHSSLGQEEFFGPLVTLFCVKNLNEAIALMNGVDYALTGGIYSRSPAHIEKVRAGAEVGNLYINRGITGALVNRQPFGGFKLSGVGSKAGGSDYLMHFLEPKTITENTMRRGFAPEA